MKKYPGIFHLLTDTLLLYILVMSPRSHVQYTRNKGVHCRRTKSTPDMERA